MMTDDDIVQIARNVDIFLTQEAKDYNISAIDLSAIVNSRLRMMSANEGLENEYDDLIETVILPKQIH